MTWVDFQCFLKEANSKVPLPLVETTLSNIKELLSKRIFLVQFILYIYSNC